MISVKNLTKAYGKTLVLNNINLEIQNHEFIVLLGSSGCGKTTFLRLISGLDEASSGDIYFNDKKMNDVAPKDRNISMVFQDYALFPDMNVYQNIAFGLQIRKYKKQEIQQMVLDIAKKLKIEKLLKRKPSQLSGGEKQRVALARAMVKKPDIYLFDEPLSNLDVNLKEDFMALIKQMHEETNATFIYVTHAQNEALKLADEIVLMKDGTIVQKGKPYEIYNHPNCEFAANFLGLPKINIISINDTLRIGIRPENIKINIDMQTNDLYLVGTVDSSEFLGNGYLIKVKAGEDIFNVFSLNNYEDDVSLSINKNDLIFFNTNGDAIDVNKDSIKVLQNGIIKED